MKSGALLLVSIIGFTVLAAAPSAQHHPFSELYPPNVDLDIGGKDLVNVSKLEAEILQANSSDIYFQRAGGSNALWWDESQAVWSFEYTVNLSSNLNAGNNTISDVGPAEDPFDAVNKSYVDQNDDTVSDDQNLEDVLSRGNSPGNFNINLTGQPILTGGKQAVIRSNVSDRNITVFEDNGNVKIPNGNLDLRGNNITDTSRGNVTFGTDVLIYGNAWGKGADLAEIYASKQQLEPGEVVAPAGDRKVERTYQKFQKTLGVVSKDPGFVMNSGEDGYEIGLRGRLDVKIVSHSGRVEPGDYLVASSSEGEAVKCETRNEMEAESLEELKQISRHNRLCENRAIGKALENGKPGGKVEVAVE